VKYLVFMVAAVLATALATRGRSHEGGSPPAGPGETPSKMRATAREEKLTVEEWRDRGRQFHGHLGAWLDCGLRLGLLGRERLEAPKYFGLETEVHCVGRPPVSCLLDGLQLSTGCTLGKQNIKLVANEKAEDPIRVKFTREDGKSVVLTLSREAPGQFAAWNAALSEEETFKRVWEMPVSRLLEEGK
jgi:formylmethanofuran dehydrogenase subunit E